MSLYLFTRNFPIHNVELFCYAIDRVCMVDESGDFRSIDELAGNLALALGNGFQGEIPVTWEAPERLKTAYRRIEEYRKMEKHQMGHRRDISWNYGVIQPERRGELIQRLSARGIKIKRKRLYKSRI